MPRLSKAFVSLVVSHGSVCEMDGSTVFSLLATARDGNKVLEPNTRYAVNLLAKDVPTRRALSALSLARPGDVLELVIDGQLQESYLEVSGIEDVRNLSGMI